MADEEDAEHYAGLTVEPAATANELLALRRRAREIVNLTLELVDRVADANVPEEERAACRASLAKLYAAAIGVSVKHAARMALIEALEAHALRRRCFTEADVREHYRDLAPFGGLSDAAIRNYLERDRPGGDIDLQNVRWTFARSFPDRAAPLYTSEAARLIVDALIAVPRTEGQHRKPGEDYKWEAIAALMNAANLGPVKPSTLAVEWSRWRRATHGSARAIVGKRRGRPPKISRPG